jgi:hypothetical protein
VLHDLMCNLVTQGLHLSSGAGLFYEIRKTFILKL